MAQPLDFSLGTTTPEQTKYELYATAVSLHLGGLSLRKIGIEAKAWPTLELPHRYLRYTVTKEVSFYPGDPLSLLDAFITAPSGRTNYEQQIVIFGLDEDPLLPFEGKFDRALRAIERLGALKLRCLCIQTRSPLIMLCCPILRTLGQSALVSMHIETRSDKIAKQIYPLLPRPSERLEAARALKKLNIPVNLVCSPPNFERGLERYANAAAAAAHWIQISNSAAQATASRLLGKHLKQIAPGKVNIIPDLLYADASTKPGALSAA